MKKLNSGEGSNSETPTLSPSSPYPFFRSAYSPRQRVSISFEGPGRTKQSFKNECDINTIVGRFAKTGVLSHTHGREPIWGDVEAMDFQGAMQLVANAREDFAALPSKLRDRFHNDPGALLGFLSNENNREEAIRLGLLNAPEAQATPLAKTSENAPQAPVVNPEGAKTGAT